MISQKLKKSWQYLINSRSVFHHGIGYSREVSDECGYRSLWIYERLESSHYLFAIKMHCRYFGDMVFIFAESGRFDIDDHVMLVIHIFVYGK